MITIEGIQFGDIFTNADRSWYGCVSEVRIENGEYRILLESPVGVGGVWFDLKDLRHANIDKDVLSLTTFGFELAKEMGAQKEKVWKSRPDGDGRTFYLTNAKCKKGGYDFGRFVDEKFVSFIHVDYVDELQRALRLCKIKVLGVADIPDKKPKGFVLIAPLSGKQLNACIDFLIQDRRVWNASDFARMIGVAKSLVSDVRSGKKPFSEKLAEKICKAFPEVILR